MLVTGWIEVTPDGSVHTYSIDRPEKIPPAVVDLIQKNVPTWKFKGDSQVAVTERARMTLRIVAKRIDDSHDSIGIIGANFGDPGVVPGTYVSYNGRQPPRYPPEAVNARVAGTVYLLLRVDRQGQVENAAAEQVNLEVFGSDGQMLHYRNVLADAAVNAAKKWTFNTPTTGKHVADPYWDVRVPVNFNLHAMGSPIEDTYGKWQGYIPGPRQPMPWLQNNLQVSPSSDAIPAGSISQADQALHLMTALDGA